MMSKKLLWWKSALLVLATGTALGLGFGNGCLSNVVERVIVDVLFD
jgi:hypothetical protein